MVIIGMVVSSCLVLNGLYRIKKNKSKSSESALKTNLLDFMTLGIASGFGQLIGGILVFIATMIGVLLNH